jgi:hypothetical protein
LLQAAAGFGRRLLVRRDRRLCGADGRRQRRAKAAEQRGVLRILLETVLLERCVLRRHVAGVVARSRAASNVLRRGRQEAGRAEPTVLALMRLHGTLRIVDDLPNLVVRWRRARVDHLGPGDADAGLGRPGVGVADALQKRPERA